MSLRLHHICSPRLVALSFLKCFRGIRRKNLLKINVIPDLSVGEPLKIFRGECREMFFFYSSLANRKFYVWGITSSFTELERRRKESFKVYYTASDLLYDCSSVVANQSLRQQTEGSIELKGQNKIGKSLKNEKTRSVKAKGCQLLSTLSS